MEARTWNDPAHGPHEGVRGVVAETSGQGRTDLLGVGLLRGPGALRLLAALGRALFLQLPDGRAGPAAQRLRLLLGGRLGAGLGGVRIVLAADEFDLGYLRRVATAMAEAQQARVAARALGVARGDGV